MRQIPGMTVISPADGAEFAAVLMELARNPRPAYVCMNDGDGRNLHPDGIPAAGVGAPQELCARDGAGVTLLSSGTIGSRALDAARMLGRRGVPCQLVALPTLKPFGLCDACVADGCRLLVSVEEHARMGGLGSAVAEWLADAGHGTPLLRLGMPDAYLKADTRDALLDRAGLSPEGIAQSVEERLSRLP